MEKFDRSTRRHQRERVRLKRLRQFHGDHSARRLASQGKASWEYLNVARILNTPAFCKCLYCHNPRAFHGNGLHGVSKQEWKFTVAQRCDRRAEGLL
jgi:hypothetical protein